MLAVSRRRTARPFEARGGPFGQTRQLDEFTSYDVLKRLGICHAPILVIGTEETNIKLPFSYPVVVKALSSELTHKSDVGGVALDVKNEAELLRAVREINERLRDSIVLKQVMIQPRVSGICEVLLGFRRDPDVGPIVLIAAGGIDAEVYRDRSLRVAPVDLKTAHEMIDELAVSRVLKGFRN